MRLREQGIIYYPRDSYVCFHVKNVVVHVYVVRNVHVNEMHK